MVITIQAGDITVLQVVKLSYTTPLNNIRAAEFFVDGANTTTRGELIEGTTVKIYRNNTLEFEGEINAQKSFQGGGIVVSCIGQEVAFAEEDGPVDAGKNTKIYTSTNDNTIFADLVSNVAGWSSDVIGSSATSLTSFKRTDSESNWNTITRLLRLGKKDLEITDSSKTIKLVDRAGSSSTVATFNEGINVSGVTYSSKKAVPKVIVYGKGDGEFQITATAGSGTPVHKVIDRNIASSTEASVRATAELARISAAVKIYKFVPTVPNLNISIGDQVELTAHSVGLNKINLDVVSITRTLEGTGAETLQLEVATNAFRQASKSLSQHQASSQMNLDVSRTGMNGSANMNTWGNQKNADSTTPLVINFNVPAAMIQDEAGNIRVSTLTVDYDVDKFNLQYGNASFNGADPQVLNTSADKPATTLDASGVSATTTILDFEGSDPNANQSITSTYAKISTVSIAGGDYDIIVIDITMDIDTGPPTWMAWKINIDGVTRVEDFRSGLPIGQNVELTYHVPVNQSYASTFDVDLYIKTSSSETVDVLKYIIYSRPTEHTHGPGSLASALHSHNNGSYDINNADIDDITIGDSVGEAAGVNSSQVSIHLDFWNGSSWTLDKHTVLNTGKTLDTDVDISNSGTYPDAVGFWRVRIVPSSATADLVKGIVRLKWAQDA